MWSLREMWAFHRWAIADRKMYECVPPGLPVIGCTLHTHTQRPPVVAADGVFSFLFPHRETTSGAHSWSSLLLPHSTTGIRSSPALCPNSRWEPTAHLLLPLKNPVLVGSSQKCCLPSEIKQRCKRMWNCPLGDRIVARLTLTHTSKLCVAPSSRMLRLCAFFETKEHLSSTFMCQLDSNTHTNNSLCSALNYAHFLC